MHTTEFSTLTRLPVFTHKQNHSKVVQPHVISLQEADGCLSSYEIYIILSAAF